MSILFRYILREYLVPFAYCLGGFLSIYVLFELFGSFSRLLEAKLPFLTAADYFAAYLSPFFEYLMPAALMLAALYTMWNLCRHSELVALKANGISLFVIALPILVVALLAGGVVLYLNETYVPARAQWAKRMKSAKFNLDEVTKADDLVFCNSGALRTWTIGRVLDPDALKLGDVKVTVNRPGSNTRRYAVTADEAQYLDGEWWFRQPQVRHYDELGRECASPTPELDMLSFRSFSEFREKPKDFLMQNREWAHHSIGDRFRYLKGHPEIKGKERARMVYDTWAKIFAPFAGVVITLFAIPFGIATGRQTVFRGIVGALAMFFGFYGLMVLNLVLAGCAFLPPILAAAMPYLVFAGVGALAFYRQR